MARPLTPGSLSFASMCTLQDSPEWIERAQPASCEAAQDVRPLVSSSFPLFFLPPYRIPGKDPEAAQQVQPPNKQSLITAGTRLYGSSNCMDPRTCLGIKIYDFAVYADADELKKATARRHRQQQQQQQQQQWQAPKEGRPDLLLPPLDPQGDGVSGGVREVTTCGGALQALHAPQPWLDGCRDGFLQGMGGAFAWLGGGLLGGLDWSYNSNTGFDSELGPDGAIGACGDADAGMGGQEGSRGGGDSAGLTRQERRQQRQLQREQRRHLKWQNRLARRAARGGGGVEGSAPGGELALSTLIRDPQVPFSIVLRATRELPVGLLQTEMGRVLRKRFAKAGGASDSAELPQLLECFSARRLPPQCCSVAGGSGGARAAAAAHADMVVKMGSLLVFSRDARGFLSATALTEGLAGGDSSSSSSSSSGGRGSSLASAASSSSSSSATALQSAHTLPVLAPTMGTPTASMPAAPGCAAAAAPTLQGADGGCGAAASPPGGGPWEGREGRVGLLETPLHCPPLCEALLDMYLGSPPACKKAKAAAERSLGLLVGSMPANIPTAASVPHGLVYQPTRASGHVIRCTESSNPGSCVVCVP